MCNHINDYDLYVCKIDKRRSHLVIIIGNSCIGITFGDVIHFHRYHEHVHAAIIVHTRQIDPSSSN